MIQRPTWILLGLFAAVLVFAIYWQSTADQRQTASATPTIGVNTLLPFSGDALAKVTVENRLGKRVEMRRDQAGSWTFTGLSEEEVDVAAVETAVSQLANLRVITSLEPAADLNTFGLFDPSHTIIMVLNDAVRHTLQVGDVTPTQNGYYVQLNSNPPQVASKSSLDPLINLIENPPLLPTATIGVSETITGTGTIEPVELSTPTLEP